MGVDYLPKIQGRKLYQYAQERKEAEREARRQRELEEKRAESGSISLDGRAGTPAQTITPESQSAPVVAAPPVQAEAPKPDELTEKLKKLKMLFDNGLISQEEYNHKKLELLSDL